MTVRRACRHGLFVLFCAAAPLSARAGDGFDLVVLGARGGIQDGNLSSVLVRPHGKGPYVACDAGTLVAGLITADRAGAFADVVPPAGSHETRVGFLLRHEIAGYLISHAHLDHVAGLVIASPDDAPKPLYALPSVISTLEQHVFNWAVWPNFGSSGVAPLLGTYRYVPLSPAQALPVAGTGLTVAAYPLDHADIESTAFVLTAQDDVLAFFGDTGSDAVQHDSRMHDVWRAIAPAVRAHHLRGIMIEVSYDDSQPTNRLFGHLTPSLLLASLHDLESQSGGKGSLRGLPVLVEHVKYSLQGGPSPQAHIMRDLERGNDLGVRFVMPEQGLRARF